MPESLGYKLTVVCQLTTVVPCLERRKPLSAQNTTVVNSLRLLYRDVAYSLTPRHSEYNCRSHLQQLYPHNRAIWRLPFQNENVVTRFTALVR